MTSAATDEEPLNQYYAQDESVPRFSFDSNDMLDYLGLAGASHRTPNGHVTTNPEPSHTLDQSTESDYGFPDPEAYLTSVQLRNRSSTLGVQQLRPRLGNGEGRARSSSYLPSFALSAPPVNDQSSPSGLSSNQTRSGNLSGAQTPYSGNVPHSSLLNAALQNRLHQYNAASSPHASDPPSRTNVNASRPRATSMGVLDQPNARVPLLGQYRAGPAAQQGVQHPTFESMATPPGSAGNLNLMVPSNGLTSHSDSQSDLSAFLASGRNRAGTIAAFSGPGGRARAEQELMRMAQLQYDAAVARELQSRPQSSGAMEALPSSDMYNPSRPQQQQQQQAKTGQRSGTSSPFVQPTRTLWVGHLRPTVTSQDILPAFSHYGPIDTFRLVLEKGCAFINYVEIADAIRAREDIVGRLGGRLGLGTIGPEGQVRIGFGKPDSVPQAGLGSFAPSIDSFGTSADTPGTPGLEVFGAEPANQEPSRALWIGSIPASTSSDTLLSIFAPFGPIESVRVLASKSCAFINFERLDDAMVARKTLHGRDVLGAEVGAVRIGSPRCQPRCLTAILGRSTQAPSSSKQPWKRWRLYLEPAQTSQRRRCCEARMITAVVHPALTLFRVSNCIRHRSARKA